jgi:ribosomal protein L30/L7E
MKFSDLSNREITIEQIKSGSKFSVKQKSNLIGLGLRGIGSKSNLRATSSVLGMVKKVGHILKIKLK